MKASSTELNHRQLALVSHAIKTPRQRYTFQSHVASHGVTHETARNDLLALVEKGLLQRARVGRRHVFSAAPDLADLLARDC
jgi:Fic family protein